MTEFWNSVYADAGYEKVCERSRLPFWLLILLSTLNHIVVGLRFWFWSEVAHCSHPEPHYHSDDWAGPDSGGMGGYCDRCGFSFHSVLY